MHNSAVASIRASRSVDVKLEPLSVAIATNDHDAIKLLLTELTKPRIRAKLPVVQI